MNPNKLTVKSQEALEAARSIAEENGNQAIEPDIFFWLFCAMTRESPHQF